MIWIRCCDFKRNGGNSSSRLSSLAIHGFTGACVGELHGVSTEAGSRRTEC